MLKSLISTAQSTASSASSKANSAYNLANNLKIEIISYVGTGTYGENNPTSLSFSFAPDVVFYLGNPNNSGLAQLSYFGRSAGYVGDYYMMTNFLSQSYAQYCGFGYVSNQSTDSIHGKISADKKTYTWYAIRNRYPDGSQQNNQSGITYYYLALKG